MDESTIVSSGPSIRLWLRNYAEPAIDTFYADCLDRAARVLDGIIEQRLASPREVKAFVMRAKEQRPDVIYDASVHCIRWANMRKFH